jgi:hypothetical protein
MRLRRRAAAVGVLSLAAGSVLVASTLTEGAPAEHPPIRIRAGCDAYEARAERRCDDDGDHVPCREMEHMTEWQCRGPAELATPTPTPTTPAPTPVG